jgi:predicted metal-binding membrane protein
VQFVQRPTSTMPLVIPVSIALAWAIAIVAQFSGWGRFLHHDALIERGPGPAAALALFVTAWLVMIAAMMLPSSLPLIRLFAFTCAKQPRHALVFGAFLGGYAVVWSAFGIIAFAGDVAVHASVDRIAWLNSHPWMIAGSVLALAGVFQFTPLKDACLKACRLPGNFLMRYYRQGLQAAFQLGYRHGLFCVGCCWALMLISFAAGFASLWWMAALTALMVYEKTARRGHAAVHVAGAALLFWSALVFTHPHWLPAAFAGI